MTSARCMLFAVVALAAVIGAGKPSQAGPLPKGFVWLSDIDSTIVEDIRYATAANFTHAPVPGYAGASCILASPVARALAKVQADLRKEALTLVVYDCYRPAMAVRAMVSAMKKRAGVDPVYHPRISGKRLVALGYVAVRSGHSSGGSVDVGLGEIRDGNLELLDMGTTFDTFDEASYTASPTVGQRAMSNRARLVAVMKKHGFVNYRREWWHYRYEHEPFRGRSYDFPVVRPEQQ